MEPISKSPKLKIELDHERFQSVGFNAIASFLTRTSFSSISGTGISSTLTVFVSSVIRAFIFDGTDIIYYGAG